MKSSNIKIFIVIAAILGFLVIGVEVGNILLGKKPTQDAQDTSALRALPSKLDIDTLNNSLAKETFLLISQDQFLGKVPTTTVTPTPSNQPLP